MISSIKRHSLKSYLIVHKFYFENCPFTNLLIGHFVFLILISLFFLLFPFLLENALLIVLLTQILELPERIRISLIFPQIFSGIFSFGVSCTNRIEYFGASVTPFEKIHSNREHSLELKQDCWLFVPKTNAVCQGRNV